MFKNTFQSGFLSILYSLGYVRKSLIKFNFACILCMLSNEDATFVFSYFVRSKPLQIWDKEGL